MINLVQHSLVFSQTGWFHVAIDDGLSDLQSCLRRAPLAPGQLGTKYWLGRQALRLTQDWG
eukprot:2363842-Pyramimonas_sp.AAC.1